MIKNILKIIGFFVVGIVGGIFADQILWPYFVERPLFFEYQVPEAPVYINKTEQIIIQENTALQTASEKSEKAVMGLKSKLPNGTILQGSGFILTSDGYLITLADLVPKTADITFFWEDKEYRVGQKATILKRDTKNNLALVKIDQNDLPTAGFADLEKTKRGQRVFLIGVVFEKEQIEKIVNEGIIKNFSEDIILTNIFEEKNLAGSALFDIEGYVLGLNMVDKEGKVTAIPVSKIRSFSGF